MKLIVLYRPYSEHARAIEEFIHDFTRRNPDSRTELVNVDGRDGSATASLYDIMNYPGILALQEDGSALMSWQGLPLPLLDEVAAYVHDTASF